MAKPPPLIRKSSAPWDRLRPIRQDPLQSMGFVSKGDSRLLELKNQESFYQKIVDRYMEFCSQHGKDLDAAFTSLFTTGSMSASSDPTQNPGVPPFEEPVFRNRATADATRNVSTATTLSMSKAALEISNILMALRKLREGLLGSSSKAPSPVFSQRVHVFNIRAAILAMHPPSYHPSLSYLLSVLNTAEHPLPRSEIIEMTTYAILDRALRQDDLIAAYTLRHESHRRFGYESRTVNVILRAVVTNNWVQFWRIRDRVDGHVRAIMQWYIESSRKTILKTFSRAYLKCNVQWILQSATGGQMSWEELAEKEQVGWLREADTITIRKPKSK